MPALLTFTVSVDGPADARLRRFRVSLPRAPKWERARTGQLLELLITRALACDASAPRSSAHLATMRGPIGNDEPLRAHVCTGDEVRLCEGEAPRGESTSLWMWGEGGQLGKVSALSGVNVTAIALGSSHAAVLTGSGLVLTWGANDYGQLGTGDEVAHSAPRVVSALARSARVRLLACGPRYTAVVSAAGELYTWGQNQPSSTPSRFYDSWLNAGAREHADERRRLREWQQAREGELGGGQDAGGAQPQLDSCCGLGVRELACGTEHMAIVDEAGEIYLWGYNDQGQCGLQRGQLRSATRFLGLQKPRAPLQLPSHPSTPFALRPLRVACGAAHTLVLTSDHQLFGFGCNTCGQLGLAERTTRLLPTRVPWDDRSAPIVDVIAAGHATMVRLADGRALLLGRLAAGSGNGFLPLMPPVGRREGGGANDAAAGNDDGGGEDAGGNGGGGNGGDGDGEPSRAAAGFELPSLPLAVSDNVMRMAMSDAHVLMQAAGDSSILGCARTPRPLPMSLRAASRCCAPLGAAAPASAARLCLAYARISLS